LLKNAYDGDIRRRKELAPLTEDEQNGGHARRVMTSYETWLSAAGEHSMLAVLRLLGLFNRPADASSLAALRAAPVIPGLTDGLQHLKEHEWRQTVAKLRRFKLLAESDAGVATDFSLSPVPGQMLGQTKVRPTDELDAHALVREHFGQQMKRDHPDAWRAANLRLYEHLTTTAKEFPDTMEEMSPLYAAVAHGCEAGRHQQALDDVFWRRIRRGEEAFSTRKLGAFGADLVALTGFFEIPWLQPVAGLTESDQAFVLNLTGYDLYALGRLQEADELMHAGLQSCISQENWTYAASVTSELSELHLTIGDLPQALEFARRSVELADRSGDEYRRLADRATLADALHQAGQLVEAAATFRQAEEMQRQRQPESPILYSLRGFEYCELLLGQGKHQEVKERAARTIEIAKRNHLLLDLALDNLSLGRACLLESRQTGAGDYRQVAEFLQQAVDGLRQAGYLDDLPRGLLARAELRRVTGDYPRARADLDEAQRIAERSQMGLHLADCHLERGRLCLALGDRDTARKAWETAKAMIERMGYHRRDSEVVEIEAQLNSALPTE
jgi:tetratricopeptide (TPR) repeat protein